MTLFRQQFRALFAGLLVWCGAGLLLAYSTVAAVPGMAKQGELDKLVGALPAGLQSMLGIPVGVSATDGLVAIGITKSMIIPAVLYAVLLALAAITREVDRRTIDFLLSLPVRRTEVLASRVAVMLVNTGIQAGVMWATLCLGVKGQGLPVNWSGFALIFFNIWLLGIAVGGITLLASLWVDDYSFGVKLFLGLTGGLWALEFALRAAETTRWARFYSPFSYVDPGKILQGGLPAADVTVLAVVAALTIGLAFPAFRRKQISV